MGIVFPPICNRKPNQTIFFAMLWAPFYRPQWLKCSIDWYAICRLVKCHDLLDKSPQCQIINISQISSESTSLVITLSIVVVVVVICLQLDAKEIKMYNRQLEDVTKFCFFVVASLLSLGPFHSLPLIRLWFYLIFVFVICAEQLNDIEHCTTMKFYTINIPTNNDGSNQ